MNIKIKKNLIRKNLSILVIFIFLFSNISCFAEDANKKSSEKKEVVWLSYKHGLKKAKKEKKYIFIFFDAAWCYWCRRALHTMNSSDKVVDYLNKRFSPIRVNADTEEDLIIKYRVRGVPTMWFLEPNGKPISPISVFSDADEFLMILKYIDGKYYKKMGFDEYIEKFSNE